MKRSLGWLKVMGVAVIMTAVLLAVAGPAAAQAPGLQRKIVVFQEQAVDQPSQAALLRGAGGLIDKPVPSLNAWAVALPAQAVRALLARAEVARIDDDLEIHALGVGASARGGKPGKPKPPPSPQPAQIIPWGIERVGAPAVWAYSGGTGVKVAILDTGIDLDHPDLAANIAGGYNAIRARSTYDDDNGHGTHIAGSVAALDNSIGVVGVAPQASLYAVKALDRKGVGRLSSLINGLAWCISQDIQIVNMSLGSSGDNLSFHQSIQAAYDAGIVLVAAAGNSGGTPVDYPAAYPECISVSATDSTDQLAGFSSWGKVDLAAPGDIVYSTYNTGYYATGSGTSMAAPHVSGVAALYLALHGGSDPEGVKAALQATADTTVGAAGDPLWSLYFGAGLVNAVGAVMVP